MLFCSKCGAQNADGVSFCTNCGAALTPVQPQQPQQPQQTVYYAQPQPQPVYYAQPMAPAKKEVSKGRKIASLILGIFAFLFALAALGLCWIPWVSLGLAFSGLITGIVACALSKRGLAIAAIVISSITIVVAIVILIIYLVAGAGAAALGGTDFQSIFDDFLSSFN